MRQAVDSIEALLAVGDDAFRRIATMAIASEFNGSQPPELLCMAMVRGRFCEVAGLSETCNRSNSICWGCEPLAAMQGQSMNDWLRRCRSTTKSVRRLWERRTRSASCWMA